ncbi:MAG: glycosyltransferase family 4 protein [Armatimonadota bacterium]|nr:MAG: glycosyltransferase family 4 protein [Armatimonadota bacterium]
MTIVVVHQQFLRPDEGGGSRFNEFSRLWTEAGHRVVIIAGQTSYATGGRAPEYRGHWVYREKHGGATVLRVYTPEARMTNFLSRIWNFLCFMLSATWAVLFVAPHPHMMIASSPQLIVAVPGVLGSLARRCPLVFEVRDLWPETGITMGAIRPDSLSARALYALEALAYRRAAAVNVLTPAFRDSIVSRQLAPAEKVWLVPNGADLSLLPSPGEREKIRETYGWQDRLVVLYAGAHGIANDLMQFVLAAEALREEQDIVLVTVGSGAELPDLRDAVKRRGLDNIRLLGPVPKRQMPGFLAAADVGAAILRRCQTFRTVYPNKMFDYMSAGLPVLLAIDGVARELVENAGAGVYVEPGDTDAMRRAILWLRGHPAKAAEMGRRGETYVREHFDRAVLAERYLAHMEQLRAARRRPVKP